ncbi:MAG: hypothetical protein AB1432_14115 [Bacteroidota bacterium]
MKTKIIFYLIYLATSTLLTAQDKISLTDIEKVRVYLSLDEHSFYSIKSIVKEIEAILEEDKKIIDEIKERVKNDDEPGFFEKIKIKKGRDDRISRIKSLTKKIENQLDKEQKEKFKNVIKPELKGLKKEEIFNTKQ